MEFREKLDFCEGLMCGDFGMTINQVRRLINDLEIEDAVFEYYHEEIEELEREKEAESDYNERYYADGWSDHIGV